MANSITGINDDIISQAVLEGYTTAIAPLAAFATDFSSEAARRGEKVSIMRDNTAIDAAVDKTTHADYTIQDADSDAVEVTLGPLEPEPEPEPESLKRANVPPAATPPAT